MPVVNLPPNPPATPEPPKQVNAALTDAPYRHALVDAAVTPSSALLTHIEGASWYVDYYSQVLGGDDEVTPFQPDQAPVYQQYLLIKGFELKLQGSLSTSDEESNAVMTVTGSALLYPGMKPNKGDAFIADIGDGRAGQFSVDTAAKKTILKETCYEISFTLVRYANKELVDQINRKVVKTTHFRKDFLLYGQNPILATEALEASEMLKKLEKTLLGHWISLFFSQEFRTFLVPGQLVGTYDPYVVAAIKSMYDRMDHPLLGRIRELNVDGLPRLKQYDLWTAIITQDAALLQTVFRTAHCIPITAFSNHPYFDGIRYSGLGQVVGPDTDNPFVDADYVPIRTYTGAPLQAIGDMSVELTSIIFNNLLTGHVFPDEDPLPADSIYLSDEVSYIHPVTADNGYVLTQYFYEQSEINRSKFEIMVQEYFDTGNVNHTVLAGFCGAAREWGRLEKYYYIPILLALLKVAQRMI